MSDQRSESIPDRSPIGPGRTERPDLRTRPEPGEPLAILLVEDNPGDARLVRESLSDIASVGFAVTHVARLAEAVAKMRESAFDAVLLDLGLPDAHGLEALAPLAEAAPSVPVIVFSGLEDEALAVSAVQRGAQDYVVKGPGTWSHLARSVRYAIERKQAELYISHLAHHDQLTSLPNRRLFEDRLQQALARTRRNRQLLAVLFLDLDEFKQINDGLGHAVGDRLLQEVASRLRLAVRASDTVARLGGDEFALVLPEVDDVEHADAFARKILTALAEPFLVAGRELRVTASMGLSLYPADGGDGETLLKCADTAMYRCKHGGANGFQFFTTPASGRRDKPPALADGLRQASEKHELFLHYQPQLALATGRVAVVEALVRWEHPPWGTVAPATFLRLAEELGLLAPIGAWTLRQACAQLRVWVERGLDAPRIAINVSSRQITDGTLPEVLRRVLHEAGIDPGRFELELSACSVVSDTGTAARVLGELEALGLRLVVDDFGMGPASFSHLKQFPVHALKIDRGLVGGIGVNPVDEALVISILVLGQELGVEVVAEGVTTAEQAQFLKARGCARAQGALFSAPMPADELTHLLEDVACDSHA